MIVATKGKKLLTSFSAGGEFNVLPTKTTKVPLKGKITLNKKITAVDQMDPEALKQKIPIFYAKASL
jgi:hypothetical protein